VELFAFDRAYVERLRAGDPAIEQHFFAYFDQLLRIKLRARRFPPDKVEDLCQETYIRVFATLRRDGVREPDRFGAFVNSICSNVIHEDGRKAYRNQPLEDTHLEIPDRNLDIEGELVTKQSRLRVRAVLDEMDSRDGQILRDMFLQDMDKDQICLKFHVDRGYLRVLIHRAKDRFKQLYEKDRRTPPPRAGGAKAQ
jgi:RNA polymerase sigma-70 factor, ECF subfamily